MTRRIMWLVMTQGVVFICGIFLFSGIKSYNPAPANYEMIRYIFLLLTVTTILSLGKIKSSIDNKPTAKPPQYQSEKESQKSAGFFVVMALCEGSILIGLLLSYLSGNPNDIYTLAAPGLIGMLINFPRNV